MSQGSSPQQGGKLGRWKNVLDEAWQVAAPKYTVIKYCVRSTAWREQLGGSRRGGFRAPRCCLLPLPFPLAAAEPGHLNPGRGIGVREAREPGGAQGPPPPPHTHTHCSSLGSSVARVEEMWEPESSPPHHKQQHPPPPRARAAPFPNH